MKRNDPPAIATWILEHLCPGGRNEALAGDLLEEFRHGRSSLWYWRQVLAAIAVGCAQEARAHWLVLVFSVLWTVPVPALDIFVLRRIEMIRFFAQRWDLAWPYSTIADLGLTVAWNILYAWVGLVFCFAIISISTHSINLHRIVRALWISAVIYMAAFAGVIACVAVFPFHGALIDIRRVTPVSVMTGYWFLFLRVPCFLGLLAALLAIFPKREHKQLEVAG